MRKTATIFLIFFALFLARGEEQRSLFLPVDIYEEYEEGNIDNWVNLISNQGWNEVYIPVYSGEKAYWPSPTYQAHNGPIHSENDILRSIIKAFQENDIRVSAWFKGGLQVSGEVHPLYQANSEWFSQTSQGNSLTEDKRYISPASHEGMQMLKDMIHELVRDYPIHGIGIDNFTWGSVDLGYGEKTLARYRDSYHLPPDSTIDFEDDQWHTFRQNLLNRQLKEIYRLIKAVNPYIHVSGIAHSYDDTTTNLQPWKRWLKGGYADSIIIPLRETEKEEVSEEIESNQTYAGPFRDKIYFSHTPGDRLKDDHFIIQPQSLDKVENIEDLPWDEIIAHPYHTNRLQRKILTVEDSARALIAGEWQKSSNTHSLSNEFIKTGNETTSVFAWLTSLPQGGTYNVYIFIPELENKHSEAQYRLSHDSGSEILTIDQSAVQGEWLKLGQWDFPEDERITLLTLSNEGVPEDKYVVADAIKLEHVPVEPEVRAAWTSRYQWTAETVEESKQNIREQMERLREYNFNAVAFQARPCMETYYPNPYEPYCGEFWDYESPGIDPETGEEFDALEYAIIQARLNDLKFYCYINTHTITVSSVEEEVSPTHRYHLHAHDEAEEDWRLYSDEDTPLTEYSSYVWICPAVPGAEAWTRKMVNYVVDNYEVDGVHFDRIRTPGNDFTYNPISRKRFEDPYANPDEFEDIGDFMRKQITDQLERIMGDTNILDPTMEISTAPFGIVYTEPEFYDGTGTESHYQWFQASFDWLERGVVDEIFPQIYWEIESAHPFEVLYAQWLHHSHGRHIHAGINNRWNEVNQIKEVRRQGGPGNILWHINNADYQAIKEEIYQEPAPVPPLSWKTFPETGKITGTVYDDNNEPIQDALINVNKNSYNYVSGADGRFSMVNKPADTYKITVQRNEYTTKEKAIEIQAGETKNINIFLEKSE